MKLRGLTPSGVEDCPYRHHVGMADGGLETATCGLLEEILGEREGGWCCVEREVCESCCRSSPASPLEPNPVVSSLLYSRATRRAASLAGGDEADRLRSVADWARDRLDIVYTEPLSFPANQPAEPGARTLAELVPPPSARHGPRVRDWAVGVTTAPRVQPVLETCLASLIRAGWKRPRLFIDAAVRVSEAHEHLPRTFRDERVGAWPSYYLALTELLLRHPRADAYMIVQDDALFFDREPMIAYLETILWPGRQPCLASLYCCDADTAAERGWHATSGPMKGGPVALAFPRDVAKEFVTDRDVFERRWAPDELAATSIGDAISFWAYDRGVPVWLPTPSLVQHIGDTSAIWPMARAQGIRRARQFAGDDP